MHLPQQLATQSGSPYLLPIGDLQRTKTPIIDVEILHQAGMPTRENGAARQYQDSRNRRSARIAESCLSDVRPADSRRTIGTEGSIVRPVGSLPVSAFSVLMFPMFPN